MYRPLVLLSYALNYQLGGYEVRGYRLANIGFHLGTAWLFCALLIRLGAARQLALLGALIFALHPLTAEPVNYISSRSESLAVLFLVAAFYFYAGAQKALSIPSLLCFALALLSKSVGLVLPGLLVLHEWSSGTGWWRRSARRQWPYWLLGAGYLLFTWRLIHEAVVQAPVRHWTAQLSTQIKALGYYLKLLVVPYPLSVEHQFFESSSFAESAPVLVLGLLASLALMGWRRLRGGGRRGIFWCAWCLLALLPTLVVPLNVLVSERRLYLVLAGFIGFSLWLIQQRLETKRVLSFGAVADGGLVPRDGRSGKGRKRLFECFAPRSRQRPGAQQYGQPTAFARPAGRRRAVLFKSPGHLARLCRGHDQPGDALQWPGPTR